MTYSTIQDMQNQFGDDDLLSVADRDGDNAMDLPVINAALDRASSEIDSYLATRYKLPLSSVDISVKGVCLDIAMYHLSQGAGLVTEDKRQRYEDAIAWLRRVSDGKAALPGQQSPNSPSPKPIVIAGPERQFRRDQLKGL
ncbi:gp436 family protein [Kiloniella litopenaei]|uniref:gp436 family protein n=1 Tax=Kiloniella litopenaei TaxID=1549748 RepID=UPI003BAD0376